jgi:hypothetical protein
MSKGAVIAAVVVGGVVILGGATLAMAAPKPVILPDLGPPPPAPPRDSLGQAIVKEGFAEASKAYEGLTGSKLTPKTVALDVATGGIYSNAKVVTNAAKKVWNSIF